MNPRRPRTRGDEPVPTLVPPVTAPTGDRDAVTDVHLHATPVPKGFGVPGTTVRAFTIDRYGHQLPSHDDQVQELCA